ncbi:hypothetical protein GIB67_038229 [Kingdonia uniflora]|uniref:Rad26/CSB-like winged helix DNA-binding domain-containing protein n=1 Tax=Kingdonia uniflora TaxID=39325 RepID=A0A7J7NHQ7_9MAGN|nr:hypothetical protein GIB67_038229 [Kingdonia uniflora]
MMSTKRFKSYMPMDLVREFNKDGVSCSVPLQNYLKNSRSQDSIYVPTRTGRSGAAGTPPSVLGASAGKVLFSSKLLARIRGIEERSLFGVPPEVLILQICTFLQGNGGRTSSAIIVWHFKDRIPSNDLPPFKSLLKEIATLKNRLEWIYGGAKGRVSSIVEDQNGYSWLVHERIYQNVLDQLIEVYKQVTIGDPLEKDTYGGKSCGDVPDSHNFKWELGEGAPDFFF